MAENDFEAYLTDRYLDQVNWYDGKAVTSQAIYRRMQWAIIVLAAITPVLIEVALNLSWVPSFAHVPAATAAMVAILTAGLKAFKFQENWINYRTTCETLRKEKYFYDWGLEGYDGKKDKKALFVERVERLISQENTIWLTAQRIEAKPKEQPEKAGD